MTTTCHLLVQQSLNKYSAAAKKVGSHVRKTREWLGISQQDLVNLSEVIVATLGKIERCVQNPNLESLVKIASALEVSTGALVAGSTAAGYGPKKHQVTVRDLIAARAEAGH